MPNKRNALILRTLTQLRLTQRRLAARTNATQTNSTQTSGTQTNATQTNTTKTNAAPTNTTQTNAAQTNTTQTNADLTMSKAHPFYVIIIIFIYLHRFAVFFDLFYYRFSSHWMFLVLIFPHYQFAFGSCTCKINDLSKDNYDVREPMSLLRANAMT